MRLFRKRKWIGLDELWKWAEIARKEDLAKPGEALTVEEIRKRFEEKLYPSERNG